MDKQARSPMNRPPISLHQTPPPPTTRGRNSSDVYMVDTSALRGSSVSVSGRTQRFTRNTSDSGQPASVHQPLTRDGPTQRIRLDQQRTSPRAKNEYVDTPQQNNNKTLVLPPPICSQPKSLKADPKRSLMLDTSPEDTTHVGDSIICHICNRCKCNQCRAKKELPRTWICNKKYECSVQKVVEYCTCLCCVQCLFQTMFNDTEDQADVADDPCACCSKAHCCKRWLCMGIFSMCIPCLCCYPLCKGGELLCTQTYNSCTNRGCQCRKETGCERLLLDSESSSTTT